MTPIQIEMTLLALERFVAELTMSNNYVGNSYGNSLDVSNINSTINNVKEIEAKAFRCMAALKAIKGNE